MRFFTCSSLKTLNNEHIESHKTLEMALKHQYKKIGSPRDSYG